MEKEATKWCDMLDKNPGEEWLKRVTALQGLAKLFRDQEGSENDSSVWSPALFRILRLPIQRQIKDLRSGITKEVGDVLVAMSVSGQDAVGPFFLDIFLTILETLNSGNKVIFGHIDVAMQQVWTNPSTIFHFELPLLLLSVLLGTYIRCFQILVSRKLLKCFVKRQRKVNRFNYESLAQNMSTYHYDAGVVLSFRRMQTHSRRVLRSVCLTPVPMSAHQHAAVTLSFANYGQTVELIYYKGWI